MLGEKLNGLLRAFGDQAALKSTKAVFGNEKCPSQESSSNSNN